MFRILKLIGCLILGLLSLERASAFSTFGPFESFQTATLDYGTRYYYGNDIELGGTKNFGEGSRLNVPIITYAYDYTFLQYFGTKGVAAVDAAMNEMNKLPSSSNTRLKKFITQGNQQINYTAQALSLTDLKSTVMSLMIEHEGLIGESHVWDLNYRDSTPTNCWYGYGVINRNYDPVSHEATPYVNGTPVGYWIWDGCSIGVQTADAIEQTVDGTSLAQYVYSAVATRYGQQVGGYYLGVTRDDIGGLSYLYSQSRWEYESLDSNSVASYGNLTWAATTTNNAVTSNNVTGLFGGVDKITYVKVGYDSLLGSAFVPRMYTFTIPFVTNGALQRLHVTRTVNRPDIIFAAGDLTVDPFNTVPNNYPNAYVRSFNFVNNGIATLGSFPVYNAVISPQEIITFNDGGPNYFNENPSFLDSLQFIIYPQLLWGSFNGTTNTPVIFPSSASIATLEQEVLSGGSTIPIGVYNPVNILGTNTTTTGTQ